MQISTDRIRDDITAIAGFTETPDHGATRPTFSTAWRQARDYVISRAEMHGCHTRVDACGNVHIRPHHLRFDTPAWLSGSHIDTVPHGGNYDGVAGIVVPLEILRAAHEAGKKVDLETIIFAEEEGPTFGLGMLGSRAWVGDLSADQLGQLKNSSDQSYIEAGVPCGVDATKFEADRFDAAHYRGLIEVHIEQGPGMWRRDQRLAVVTAIAGRRQFRVTLNGEANHAGATSMGDRKDALIGAAIIIQKLESIAAEVGAPAVATVGRLINHPNAVNVIPDRVEFTIDLRTDNDADLESAEQRIRQMFDDTCSARGLRCEIERTEAAPACPLDKRLIEMMSAAARKVVGTDVPTTVSGALHDSAILAKHLPTVMLFVPSRDGISHNPAEFSRVEDLALAGRVVAAVVSENCP